MKQVLIAVLIVWIVIVTTLNVQSAEISSSKSKYVTRIITQYIEISENTVRKTAHVAVYFILGLLLTATLKNKLALFVGILLAVLGESSQMLILTRSAELFDVFLNISGIFLAYTIMSLFARLKIEF